MLLRFVFGGVEEPALEGGPQRGDTMRVVYRGGGACSRGR